MELKSSFLVDGIKRLVSTIEDVITLYDTLKEKESKSIRIILGMKLSEMLKTAENLERLISKSGGKDDQP